MTAKSITAQKDYIERQYNRPDADTEVLCTRTVAEPHRFPCVMREYEDEQQRDIKEVAVNILHDQGEGGLTGIPYSRFANGARGWVGPKCFVVGTTIIITG